MTELITSGGFGASLFESVNWVQTFVSVFLGLLVGHYFREWSDDRKAKKRELEAKSFGYGGTWIDEIFDPEGKIKAKDRFEIAQYGNDLKGTIERNFVMKSHKLGSDGIL